MYNYPINTPETVRVVEETVEEVFDKEGNVVSKTTKTVTRYESKRYGPGYYPTWTTNDTMPCSD